jgi:hypothetical protein
MCCLVTGLKGRRVRGSGSGAGQAMGSNAGIFAMRSENPKDDRLLM